MKLSLTVVIGGFLQQATAVPLQPLFLYGHGMETFVGTPAQRYMLVPDFEGDEIRLFAGADIRSPFVEPVGHSSSLAGGDHGRTMDNITISEVEFENVPVNLDRAGSASDSVHYGDSDGRIGLGPTSVLTRSRVLTMSPCRTLIDGQMVSSFDITFPESMPDLTAGFSDVTAPIAVDASSWAFRAQVRLNGRLVAPAPFEVSLDPTVAGIVETSREGMQRIVAVFAALGVSAQVDTLGRLLLPCDARGRVRVPQDLLLTLPGGGDISLSDTSSVYPDRVVEKGMCRTGFKTSLDSTQWRFNPFFVKSLAAMYFDGLQRSVTVRTRVEGSMTAAGLPVMFALPPPRIPMYNLHTVVNFTETRVVVRFEPIESSAGGSAYIIPSLRPVPNQNGGWSYSFRPLAFEAFAPVSQDIPGLFTLAEGPELNLARPSMTLELRLRRVTATAPGRKYTVRIVRSPMMINLQLIPADGRAPRASGALQADPETLALLEMFMGMSMQGLGSTK